MYQAAQNRYNTLPTRRCGNSGLLLPAYSIFFTEYKFGIQQ